MKIFKTFLKVFFSIVFLLILILYGLFFWLTSPASDEKVRSSYENKGVHVELKYHKFKGFSYRKIQVVKDTALPTIVFVHGTIGSVMDFQRYFADSLLSQKANILAYDRVGYNYKDKNPVQESIAFEKDLLEDVTKSLLPKKLILIGYSYGGPIVLASKKKVKKVMLLAPAVYSEVEPMPWLLNLYRWKLTRWLVPPVWREASKEKLSHPNDLKNFESNWFLNPNQIISIHGNSDWIVPFSNSEYLSELFPKEQFELVTLQETNHDLIWSRFEEIRNLILKQLD